MLIGARAMAQIRRERPGTPAGLIVAEVLQVARIAHGARAAALPLDLRRPFHAVHKRRGTVLVVATTAGSAGATGTRPAGAAADARAAIAFLGTSVVQGSQRGEEAKGE